MWEKASGDRGELVALAGREEVSQAARAFSGVYRQPRGTTMRVASRRELGHTFHEKRTPSVASTSWKSPMAERSGRHKSQRKNSPAVFFLECLYGVSYCMLVAECGCE